MHASLKRSMILVLVASGLGGCLSPAPSATGGDDGGSNTVDMPGTDISPLEDMIGVEDVTPVEDGRSSDSGPSDTGDLERDMSSWELPDRPPPVEACGSSNVPIPLSRWDMDGTNDRVRNTGFAAQPGLELQGVPRVQGVFDGGSSLRFDGNSVDSHIRHHPMFEELDEGTIAVWIRPHSNSLASGTAVGLITKDANRTNSDGHWGLRIIDGTVRFRMQRGDGETIELEAMTSVAPDIWHHVAVTWTDGDSRLYLDGAQYNELSQGWSLAANPEPVGIGFETGDSDDGDLRPADSFFYGMMDEITIWDSVLPLEQIAAFWGSGTPCPTPAAP